MRVIFSRLRFFLLGNGSKHALKVSLGAHPLGARLRWALVFAGLVSFLVSVGQVRSTSSKLKWVAGYWYSPPVWGGLPAADIDYAALTHVIHCGPHPNPDGTLDQEFIAYVQRFGPELIETAHRHGVKAILCIGQPNSGNGYAFATKPENINNLVSNIMELVETFGYDGVDLDWETGVEPRQFIELVRLLRLRLDARRPKGELSGAFWEATWYLAQVQNDLDHINVMAYDECSPEDGISWHNAALHGRWYPRTRTVDGRVKQFTRMIRSSKLGLGVPFYGYKWTGGAGTETGGVTGPAQTWTMLPRMQTVNYKDLVENKALWQAGYMRRDKDAGNVPFLSVDMPGSAQDTFVTYEDSISISEKVRYAKNGGLGGIMIWELSADYLPRDAVHHPLLQAVKLAAGSRVPWPQSRLAAPEQRSPARMISASDAGR